MEPINEFNQKHNLTLPFTTQLTHEEIDEIVRVLSGKCNNPSMGKCNNPSMGNFTNIESRYALWYAGFCVKEQLFESTTPYHEYFKQSFDMGNLFASGQLFWYYYDGKNYETALPYGLVAYERQQLQPNIIGLCYLYLKQHDIARQYFLLAFENGGVSKWTYCYNIGLSFFEERRFEEADKYLSLSCENGYVDTYYRLALSYEEQHRYMLAKKYYLLAIDNKQWIAYHKLGKLCVELNEYENAEEYFLKAIDKNIFEANESLANLYYKQKRYLLAQKYFEIAKKKNSYFREAKQINEERAKIDATAKERMETDSKRQKELITNGGQIDATTVLAPSLSLFNGIKNTINSLFVSEQPPPTTGIALSSMNTETQPLLSTITREMSMQQLHEE